VLVIGPAGAGGEHGLRVWAADSETVQTLPLSGEICFTPLEGRWCTGWRDFEAERRRKCPDDRRITRGQQCDRCRIEEGFYLCLTCDGTRCPALPPAIERYCLQTHRLYLADFGIGRVKVGTASGEDDDSRVIGQGPLAAAYVARGPGPRIKRLERAASRAGLTEQMTRRRKGTTAFTRETTVGTSAVDDATRRVTDASAMLRERLTGDDAQALHEPHFVPLPPRHAYDRDVPASVIPIAPGSTIRGVVRHVRGGFALLDVLGVPAILDLGELRGRKLDPTPRDPTPPPAAQLSLFS
jgi:hypothetical protein